MIQNGFPATYIGMFRETDEGRPSVSSIEIPIIQRDYAQGRVDQKRVRDEFLSTLASALTGGDSAELDFIYGEIDATGTFRPLDGQQRLTTLFLLHWYVASAAGTLDPGAAWWKFSYATRPSAEYFCEELVKNAFPDQTINPSTWIIDQPWYLHPWRHDPTISAMLVMLDAIHQQFSTIRPDYADVWDRLERRDHPAISFLLLPIEDIGSGEELYIKMNSRGKPLTPFEVFKARLESALKSSGRHAELSEKFDREWSDLLWTYEGGSFAIDGEFMNYLGFVIDICEWRNGGPRRVTLPLDERARLLFAGDDSKTTQSLDFFFHAFDTWVGADPRTVFGELFSTQRRQGTGVRLFESVSTDLFGTCLRTYGQRFSLTETLLLFGVLVQRQFAPQASAGDVAERLRILRNLAESAPDEVRAEFMPSLLEATTRVMVSGSLDDLPRFNQARVEDERLKRDFRQRHPGLADDLNALEDHALLRGRLYVFDLDPKEIAQRGQTFTAVFEKANWPTLTGALLACGDYSRQRRKYHQFGTLNVDKEAVWRELLTTGSRDQQDARRSALQRLLDDGRVRHGADINEALKAVSGEFCARVEYTHEIRDWRYYMVKYPIMRSGASGNYVAESFDGGQTRQLGYSLCMLNTTTLGGYFRDPYLAAMRELSGVKDAVKDPRYIDQFENQPRWMELPSGAAIRCVPEGIQVREPKTPASVAAMKEICARFGAEENGLLRTVGDSGAFDEVDRVGLGARFLNAMVSSGL